MSDKMVETRFTIQFSRTDPSHLQVAEILNRQGRRSKAQYIVNAVLHYENCAGLPGIQRSTELDVKAIEAVVNRLLEDRERNHAVKTVNPSADRRPKTPLPKTEEINFDEALEALGEDGFNAVAGALDLFRRK